MSKKNQKRYKRPPIPLSAYTGEGKGIVCGFCNRVWEKPTAVGTYECECGAKLYRGIKCQNTSQKML